MIEKKKVKKKVKKRDVKCQHYKGDGYSYNLNKEQDILLCKQCHFNVAGEIVKQVVFEALLNPTELLYLEIDNLRNENYKLQERLFDLESSIKNIQKK